MRKIERTDYLRRLEEWKDRPDVLKIITGIRYSRKTTVVRQFMEKIIGTDTDPADILYLDLGSADLHGVTDHGYLTNHLGA